jgi:eukaryotic-like serine/threonine-protein kinase
MAEVYAANQSLAAEISRPVALKLIRPEYSESDDFRTMFLDEARTACTLSHPNIAHIYEVGETPDGRLFIAMELVIGQTLATVARTLREHAQRLTNEALFGVGTATLSALEAVHALKVEGGTVNLVHRDVSPHNLLLSPAGSLKLIDFGIAKAANNRNLTKAGVTKGKSGYFSPEQAMGKRLDGRSDLFSLGVTLYKLATGATPFDQHAELIKRNQALVRGQWVPLATAAPELPTGFSHVVDKSMSVNPADRFQTASEMREALEQAAFENGSRIGPSVLSGYVAEDGTIGLPRAAATPSQLATGSRPLTPRVTQPRAAVLTWAEQAKQWRLRLSTVGALAGLALGVLGMTLFIFQRPPARSQSAQPDLGAPKDKQRQQPESPPTAGIPTVVSVPDEDIETISNTTVTADPKLEPLATPSRNRPKPKTAVVQPRTVEGEAPSSAAPPALKVSPGGMGKLNVSVSNPAAVTTVLINRQDVGPPPLQLKRPSGTYRLMAKLLSGKESQVWTGVLEDDATLRLVYDVNADRWGSR